MTKLKSDLLTIQEAAKKGYNQIAHYYNDPSHETVRNFEKLTKSFLQRNSEYLRIPEISTSLTNVAIDIGGGRGWVSRLLASFGYNVILGDNSEKMLEHARAQHGDLLTYIKLSAFDLPFLSDYASLITTMLCGSYLCDDVLYQIFQILKPGGRYILTETPTDWVNSTQPARGMPKGQTWFKNSDGKTVNLPLEFIYSLEELAQLTKKIGFTVLVAEYLTPKNIISPHEISSVNKKAAKRMGCLDSDVPILNALIVEKPMT